jgi:hypothetical protein
MVNEVGSDAEILVVDNTMVSLDEQGRMIPDIEAIQGLVTLMGGN